MDRAVKKTCFMVFLVVTFAVYSNGAFAREQENDGNGSLVGRISHIEGQLLRHMPEEDDWVLTDVDTPFGEYDNLFSSGDGKAEIIMPNNTLVRIGGDTQVQLIQLNNAVSEIDVSSGTARLYNNSSSAEIKAILPFGDVIMPPGTICDIYAHETQAELASLKGTVEFIQTGSTTRFEVIAGSSSIIATSNQVIASARSIDPAWDSWNAGRDAQWAQRMQARGESAKYLPESLQADAFELDTNGRWEQVSYDGSTRYFWRPSNVSVDWTPFSSGRWIVWRGEQTWVPCEPFGYVTHHYGSWVYAGSGWYWAPPVSAVMVSAGLPLLHVGVSWYPGRVAWVSSGISIGWIPLAPFETYYCHSYWGPWSRVGHYNHYYDCHRYRHYSHARFIDHHRFYGSRDYRHDGLRKGLHNENYRGTAFVPETIRKDYKTQNRHQFASNMPGVRDKVTMIDARRDKQGGHAAGDRINTNPFKREHDKVFENNRRAGKTTVENTPRKFIKNNEQAQRRPEPADRNDAKVRRENTEKITRQLKPYTESRGKTTEQVQKPSERAFKNSADNRRTLQAPVPRTRANTRQNFETVKQGRSNGIIILRQNTSGSTPLSGRSGKTVSVSRSHNTGRSVTVYTRTGNQREQHTSKGEVQGYGARGRW